MGLGAVVWGRAGMLIPFLVPPFLVSLGWGGKGGAERSDNLSRTPSGLCDEAPFFHLAATVWWRVLFWCRVRRSTEGTCRVRV